MASLAAVVRDGTLGATPWLPWDRRFGLRSIDAELLTTAMGGQVRGARLDHVEVIPDSEGTTDRARLQLVWNAVGTAAGLPTTAFAKGTPSRVQPRILNAAFGLCGTEVQFYNTVQPELATITLRPYLARLGTGGRFLIVLEDKGPDTTFYRPWDFGSIEHAEAIIDVLARMHGAFYTSPRFDRDLAWVTTYRGRPGQVLAPKVMALAEKRFMRRDGVPDAVRRLTRLHLANGDALWRVWESLPPTLCHGDSHIGNTYRDADGTSGLFDWQVVHKMNGRREVAYFIAWALRPEDRRVHERRLVERYLDGIAEHGVGSETPSLADGFDLYRLMMVDAWTSLWATLGIGGMDNPGEAELLLDRFYTLLLDLDVEAAVRHAL